MHLAPCALGVSFGPIRVFTALQPFQQARWRGTAKRLAAALSNWEQAGGGAAVLRGVSRGAASGVVVRSGGEGSEAGKRGETSEDCAHACDNPPVWNERAGPSGATRSILLEDREGCDG